MPLCWAQFTYKWNGGRKQKLWMNADEMQLSKVLAVWETEESRFEKQSHCYDNNEVEAEFIAIKTLFEMQLYEFLVHSARDSLAALTYSDERLGLCEKPKGRVSGAVRGQRHESFQLLKGISQLSSSARNTNTQTNKNSVIYVTITAKSNLLPFKCSSCPYKIHGQVYTLIY